MFRVILLGLFILNLSLEARLVSNSEIDPKKYVILLSSNSRKSSALDDLKYFSQYDTYILKEKLYYTARIVNINSPEEAQKILDSILEIKPDAVLWKKMTNLNGESKNYSTPINKVKNDTPESLYRSSHNISDPSKSKFLLVKQRRNSLIFKLNEEIILKNIPKENAKNIMSLNRNEYIKVEPALKNNFLIVNAYSNDAKNWEKLSVPLWVSIK